MSGALHVPSIVREAAHSTSPNQDHGGIITRTVTLRNPICASNSLSPSAQPEGALPSMSHNFFLHRMARKSVDGRPLHFKAFGIRFNRLKQGLISVISRTEMFPTQVLPDIRRKAIPIGFGGCSNDHARPLIMGLQWVIRTVYPSSD